MSIQSIHARKGLAASLASIGPDVEVERLMPLAVMLASKTFLATRPLALERPLFVMRSQVALKLC